MILILTMLLREYHRNGAGCTIKVIQIEEEHSRAKRGCGNPYCTASFCGNLCNNASAQIIQRRVKFAETCNISADNDAFGVKKNPDA